MSTIEGTSHRTVVRRRPDVADVRQRELPTATPVLFMSATVATIDELAAQIRRTRGSDNKAAVTLLPASHVGRTSFALWTASAVVPSRSGRIDCDASGEITAVIRSRA